MNLARIKNAFGVALGRSVAASTHWNARATDIFLVSYPKSGNTWLRFLMANVITGCNGTVDFTNIDSIIPDIYKIPIASFERIIHPRYIKSHSAFNPAYGRVIYVVRNILDVFVSYYYYEIKNGAVKKGTNWEEYLEIFRSKRTGFGTWSQNVCSWLYAMEGSQNFLLLKYEDLSNDTLAHLKEMCEFCHITYDNDIVERASKLSSFGEMSRIERMQAHLWTETKGSDLSIPFIRSAKIGGWQSELPQEIARSLVRENLRALRKLGYTDLIDQTL